MDDYDAVIQRETLSRPKKKVPFLNIVTLICSKYIKSTAGKTGHGNFLIKGVDGHKKWDTVYRRCKGIMIQMEPYIDNLKSEVIEITKSSPEKLVDYFIRHKDEIPTNSNKRIDYKIDKKIVDMLYQFYKPKTITAPDKRQPLIKYRT